jgi:hypothetical protein
MHYAPFHFILIIIFLIALCYLFYRLILIYNQIKILDKKFEEKAFKEKLDSLIEQNEENKIRVLSEEFVNET